MLMQDRASRPGRYFLSQCAARNVIPPGDVVFNDLDVRVFIYIYVMLNINPEPRARLRHVLARGALSLCSLCLKVPCFLPRTMTSQRAHAIGCAGYSSRI